MQDIFFKGTDDVIKNCALDNGKVPLVSIYRQFLEKGFGLNGFGGANSPG